MLQTYKIRAAQIDLNRQKETMAIIRQYIDFIADNGYNTLVLYSAWRMKMKSHPYPSEDEAYTSDEIRQIVAYAFNRGLKVIPTTNLTFVNSLTRYKEMADLLEDGTRFWGSKRGNFCLSNPAIYEFIEAYLTEFAELVPSEYLHIGGDEAWDFSYCSKCTAGGMNIEKESSMYQQFILKCREIVVNKLKRRMIMWDDMFDYYPHLVKDMPRDIIFAHWQYQADAYTSVGHFGNRDRRNMLKTYDELGFEFLVAPANYLTSNGRSLYEYASQRKNLLGGIMTTWCNHLRFMYKGMPVFASIGRLWNGEGSEEECFRKFAVEYFDGGDDLLIEAVRCYCENNTMRFTNFTIMNMCNFAFSGLGYGSNSRRLLELAILKKNVGSIKHELGRCIVEELIISLELECSIFELGKHVRGILSGQTSHADIEEALKIVQQKADAYSAKWLVWRDGVQPNTIESYLNNFIEKAGEHCNKLFSGNYLRIMFAGPNQYGAEMLNIYLVKDGEKTLVKTGCFRNGSHVFFDQIFPLETTFEPDAIMIEGKGYGGQGIAYAEVILGERKFIPEAVFADGMVSNKEFVLKDNCTFAYIGNQDSMYSWSDRAAADAVNSITIALKKSEN